MAWSVALDCHHHREEDSHGWRHGDDLVFEGEDNWLDKLQKALARVMILKRQNWSGEQTMINV